MNVAGGRYIVEVAALTNVGWWCGEINNGGVRMDKTLLWENYIKTWHDLGIPHVQLNVVDTETLRAAQIEPEKYSELIVRVAGYSAHFVDLTRLLQDSIIARSVQEI